VPYTGQHSVNDGLLTLAGQADSQGSARAWVASTRSALLSAKTVATPKARMPSLLHIGDGAPPFWPRVVDAFRDDLRRAPADSPVTLAAHSNAGLFLPAIRSGLDHPAAGSIFVDAALPARTGPTPVATPELLDFLGPMAVNGRLPRWTDWWDEADIAPPSTSSNSPLRLDPLPVHAPGARPAELAGQAPGRLSA
jgi:hypothetical protein